MIDFAIIIDLMFGSASQVVKKIPSLSIMSVM